MIPQNNRIILNIQELKLYAEYCEYITFFDYPVSVVHFIPPAGDIPPRPGVGLYAIFSTWSKVNQNAFRW